MYKATLITQNDDPTLSVYKIEKQVQVFDIDGNEVSIWHPYRTATLKSFTDTKENADEIINVINSL